MITVLVLGFLIGMRHALDADHVAAVASLVISRKSLSASLRQGAIWGVGHTLTLFAFGSFVVLSGSAISPTAAALLEGAVGLMLVGLGIDVARTIVRERIHFHAHDHDDGVRHIHAHKHEKQSLAVHNDDEHQHVHTKPFPRRALLIGMMHGLAGSAALIILAIDSSKPIWEGLLYILLFGFGSIVGMAALSVGIAVPLARANRRSVGFHRTAQVVVSIANIAFGGYLIVNAFPTTH